MPTAPSQQPGIKIAYLMLVHHQPELMARTLDRVLTESCHVFIHVSGKSEIRPFQEAIASMTSSLRTKHVHFTSKRIRVQWGGWSIIEATNELLQTALTYSHFDWFILLSGSCYPVKSNEYIYDLLKKRDTETGIINIFDPKSAKRSSRIKARFEYYWSAERNNFQETLLFICLHIGTRLISLYDVLLFQEQRGSRLSWFLYRWSFGLLHRRKSFPQSFYTGSQWWILSFQNVKLIFEYIDAHPETTQFFRYVRVPDEIFYQNLVMLSQPGGHSPSNGVNDALRNVSWHYYIDWRPRGHSLPNILDEADFPALEKSEALFARKMHPVKSRTLMDTIDSHILNWNG